MNIAMACNKKWYYYLVVNLYSLLKSTKNIKKIYLLLETDKIKDVPRLEEILKKYPVEIELINFNNVFDTLVKKENINRDTIYSNFCFARLALPYLIDDDKALYIDSDAIVLKDISNVWRYNIDDYYVAGCKDYGVTRDNTYERLGITGKYVNSGFIILNLKKIREDKVHDKWFEVINNNELKYPDQDALNLVCQHKELYIPSMYNYAWNVTREVMCKEYIKVFHYAGPKIQWVVDRYYAELWYDAESRFLDEFGE